MTCRVISFVLLAVLFGIPAKADGLQPGANSVPVREKTQSVYYYPASGPRLNRKILFFPGDGGWRGVAVDWAKMMASWGYDVYGVDTKRYLSSFTDGDKHPSEADMGRDMCVFAATVAPTGGRVTLVGWSQGAGMSLLGAATPQGRQFFSGAVLIGLSESNWLAWHWSSNLVALAGKEPNEPTFSSLPYMAKVSPLPMAIIQADHDDSATLEEARKLFDEAREPKRLYTIQSDNHHLDGPRSDFNRRLQEALQWANAH